MRQTCILRLVLLAGMLAPRLGWGKITIDVIYDYDSSTDPYGFFDPTTANGQAARAAMNYAAKVYSDRLLDNFTAITSDPYNQFQGYFRNPGTGDYPYPAGGVTSVPANTINLYVGSRALTAPTLGQGGYGGYSIPTAQTQAFINNAKSRGQAGMLSSPATDYALWGGSIAFDANTDWFLGLTPDGLSGTTKADFLSVALHELGHVLGFTSGTSGNRTSFYAKISGSVFTGPHAVAAYGGNVPVYTGDLSHWNDVTSKVDGVTQKALMNTSLTLGERRKLTDLDWAAMQDMGWELARPGDANGDGSVNFQDLVTVAQNYGATGATTWSMGDFNYDGLVGYPDLVAVAQNYGTTGPLGSAAAMTDTGGSGSFAADWTAALDLASATPEPGVGMVVIALAVVAGTRRRRGNGVGGCRWPVAG